MATHGLYESGWWVVCSVVSVDTALAAIGERERCCLRSVGNMDAALT